MEEKKLTDEEIIKALECCAVEPCEDCGNCPRFTKEKLCHKANAKQSLDLIRRLQYGYSSASKASEDWKAKYEKERKENAELQKQVDELKKSQVVHIHMDEQFKKECECEIQQAVKDTAKKISKELFEKHTEIYNDYVCKNSNYDDVETNAIINFSDSLYFVISKYFKERFGVEVE